MRYAVYTVLYAVWAAAVAHSYRQYRREQVREAAEVPAAEVEQPNIALERPGVPAEELPVETPLRAGRPADPRG